MLKKYFNIVKNSIKNFFEIVKCNNSDDPDIYAMIFIILAIVVFLILI